ncbi:MAG: hypothetical protein V7746_06670 [Halioglobus sp.]
MALSLQKDITFFYSNPVERETVLPVYNEAIHRGYMASLTDNPFQRSEIGLYCQHRCFPKNAKFSLVMLHDMGQGQLDWPNLWKREPWHEFDIGFLPGESWVTRWHQSAAHPYAHPRKGIYNVGWPKSDHILESREGESPETTALRESLNLEHDISILYAPAWENDGKQDEFVQSLMGLPVNLLLKQFPWTEEWPTMVKEVARVNQLHDGIAPNVHVVNPDISIMNCIELADVLVSEESSCLMEALLLGRSTVSVSDWMIPDTTPSRLPAAPFDVLLKTPKAELKQTIERLLLDMPAAKLKASELRDNNFSNLGTSAKLIMDIIDNVIDPGQPLPELRAESTELTPSAIPLRDRFNRHLSNLVYTSKYHLGIKGQLKNILLSLIPGKQNKG